MKFQAKFGRFWLLCILFLASGVGACTGQIHPDAANRDEGGSGGNSENPFGPGGSSTGSQGGNAVSFACGQSSPPPAVLKKLTTRQLRNSVRDLVRLAIKNEAAANTAIKAIAPDLDSIPKDLRPPTPIDVHGSFTRLDQATQQGQIDVLYGLARNLGAELARPESRGSVMGACATDGDAKNDSACLDAFITSFGERVLRHSLSAEEVARFRTIHAATDPFDPAGVADVVGAMILSPYFLAFVEHGTDPVGGDNNIRQLSAFELASALSLHLWETIPDNELWAAAKSGQILTTAGYAQQVDRLLGDARAQQTFDLFTYEWLRLDELPTFNGLDKNVAFKTMAGGDLPSSSYAEALATDAVDVVSDVFRNGGNATDLLTTRRSFVKDAALAKIYGTSTWGGSGEPVMLPENRIGLLGRAFHLTSGTPKTRPIVKGVFIRRELLCDVIAAPPANAGDGADKVDKTLSIRQQIETLTSPPACAGCHKFLINGLGFATENFDALARSRSNEVVLDLETGKTLATTAIDTRATPYVVEDETDEVAGLPQLAEAMAASGKVPACLARKALRFTLARPEDEERDGCALESIRTAFASSGGLRKGWRAIVMNPEFRQRVFQ